MRVNHKFCLITQPGVTHALHSVDPPLQTAGGWKSSKGVGGDWQNLKNKVGVAYVGGGAFWQVGVDVHVPKKKKDFRNL